MTLLAWKRAAPEPAEPTRSFEEMAEPLLPALYNLASWLARVPADAEDLVQETYLKGLRGYAGFEPGTNFKAWIFRILRNTFLTSKTGLESRRTIALEDELSGTEDIPAGAVEWATPESLFLQMSNRAAVEAAMEQLPAPLLEAILLCDVEEMKYREIATVLEIPMGTVMSRIARARRQLREQLMAKEVRR
jgi:RNA polymerase sigma-70 factor (ECF subfamily)